MESAVTSLKSTGEYLTKAAGDQLTWAALPATKKTWSWGASSSASNTTNRYLDRHDGVPTNQSPYVAWFACELRAISSNLFNKYGFPTKKDEAPNPFPCPTSTAQTSELSASRQ